MSPKTKFWINVALVGGASSIVILIILNRISFMRNFILRLEGNHE
jgi:hypothetical protein